MTWDNCINNGHNYNWFWSRFKRKIFWSGQTDSAAYKRSVTSLERGTPSNCLSVATERNWRNSEQQVRE